jgi:hypothetical protein
VDSPLQPLPVGDITFFPLRGMPGYNQKMGWPAKHFPKRQVLIWLRLSAMRKTKTITRSVFMVESLAGLSAQHFPRSSPPADA